MTPLYVNIVDFYEKIISLFALITMIIFNNTAIPIFLIFLFFSVIAEWKVSVDVVWLKWMGGLLRLKENSEENLANCVKNFGKLRKF